MCPSPEWVEQGHTQLPRVNSYLNECPLLMCPTFVILLVISLLKHPTPACTRRSAEVPCVILGVPSTEAAGVRGRFTECD